MGLEARSSTAYGDTVIREDYIIGWIKRYIRWLAEITGFVKAQDYEAAAHRADLALRELLGIGADSVINLTDGEILARLSMGDPPPVVRDKCLLVATLLFHLGETAQGRGNPDLAAECWLKSLQVLLGIQLQGGPAELPEHAPKLGVLLERLKGIGLPPRTGGALLIYHEQQGEFDRAENALFQMLDTAEPGTVPALLELGHGFYGRLSVLSEEALAAGNFSRAEVETGREELKRRQLGTAGAEKPSPTA